VRLYTQYKATRRRRHPVRFFGPLVLLVLAIFWWLHWQPKKKETPRSLLKQAKSLPPKSSVAPTNQLPLAKASVPPAKLPFTSGPTNLPVPSSFGRASTPPSFSMPQTNVSNASGGAAARPTQNVFETQLALGRRGFSPGSFDGVMGAQTRAALRAFQQREHLPATGELDGATKGRLLLNEPLYANYIVTTNDIACLSPLGKTWLEKSQQPRLDYETALELVAEKSQSNPKLIQRLNPAVDWTNIVAGTAVQVPSVTPPPRVKAAFIRIQLAERVLEVFDESTNLVAHFPCSIAQRVEKRPVGELHVAVIAPNPDYTFDPENFPESVEAKQLNQKVILKPGPNNPVGTVWIGLDKSGYGIHGTPRPEDVGRTESHGCFRLANWNAEYLLQVVNIGTPVFIAP